MTVSNGRKAESDILFEKFTKDVENVTEQVTLLIQDIQESKLNFNNINNELNYLVQNVREISNIIRNDDSHKGSLLTRIALLEKAIEEVDLYIKRDTLSDQELITKIAVLETKILNLEKLTKESKNFPSDDKAEEINESKWKFYVSIATGIFTVLGTVVAVLLESGC